MSWVLVACWLRAGRQPLWLPLRTQPSLDSTSPRAPCRLDLLGAYNPNAAGLQRAQMLQQYNGFPCNVGTKSDGPKTLDFTHAPQAMFIQARLHRMEGEISQAGAEPCLTLPILRTPTLTRPPLCSPSSCWTHWTGTATTTACSTGTCSCLALWTSAHVVSCRKHPARGQPVHLARHAAALVRPHLARRLAPPLLPSLASIPCFHPSSAGGVEDPEALVNGLLEVLSPDMRARVADIKAWMEAEVDMSGEGCCRLWPLPAAPSILLPSMPTAHGRCS